MRDISIGVLAGLCGAITYWISLMVMVARAGIGPGDSLSITEYLIPTILGGLVIVAFVRGSHRRLMGSCIFWLSLFLILGAFKLLVGEDVEVNLIRFSITAFFILFPAALVTKINWIRTQSRDGGDGDK